MQIILRNLHCNSSGLFWGISIAVIVDFWIFSGRLSNGGNIYLQEQIIRGLVDYCGLLYMFSRALLDYREFFKDYFLDVLIRYIFLVIWEVVKGVIFDLQDFFLKHQYARPLALNTFNRGFSQWHFWMGYKEVKIFF